MGPNFFETGMGRSFYMNHVPALIKTLEEGTCQIKRANDLKEKQIAAVKEQTEAIRDLIDTLKWNRR